MKSIIITALMGLFCCSLCAQSSSGLPHCGQDMYMEIMERSYPGFREASQTVFERSRDRVSFRDDEILTIPVVVHIVWKEESENLDQSIIEDIIDVLNEDFRRLNADADSIRSEFADRVGDTQIEFSLAGVERVQTDAEFELDLFSGGLPDAMKRSSSGGSDAWDTEHYLNIWVCNLQGGALLGYAFPPSGLPNWPEESSAPSLDLDGVVIHHQVFKRNGNHTSTGLLDGDEVILPVRGRTITHEVGHYLGLRHVWGDGLLALVGIPNCEEDDGIDDTPNQGINSQAGGCDITKNSCTDLSDDLPDMFENYMDYSRENCQNSFTIGQINLMRSVLEGPRAKLLIPSSTSKSILPDHSMVVFPNPVSHTMTLHVQLEKITPYTIALYDVQGRLLRQEFIPSGTRVQTIDTQNFPSGMILLQLITEKGILTKRIQVMK